MLKKTPIYLLAACIVGGCTTTPAPATSDPFDVLDAERTAPQAFFADGTPDGVAPQWDIAFSPDGQSVYLSSDNPRRIVTRRWRDDRWTPAAAVTVGALGAYGSPFITHDGSSLYFSASADGGPRDLYRLDLRDAATRPQQVTDTPTYGEISLSLDRNGDGFLWTDRKSDGSAGMGFYRVSLRGDTLEIIGDAGDLHIGDPSGENQPYIDPDGRFLIFANYDITPGTREDLFLSVIDGDQLMPPVPLGSVVNTAANDTAPTLSPDGRFLLFASDRSGDDDFLVYAVPTADVAPLARALTLSPSVRLPRATPGVGPIVSPDELDVRDGRATLKRGGEGFTGLVVDRYENGQTRLRKSLVNGRAEGVWLEWYDDGVLRFYSEWREGLGEGTWIYFHPNGEVSERVNVRGDRFDGIAEGWHADGRKAFESLYIDGTVVSEKRYED